MLSAKFGDEFRLVEAMPYLRTLPCKRLQCDELWSLVGAKDANVPAAKRGQFGVGPVWTRTAIDADTKLIPSWLVGTRDGGTAYEFVTDLASRVRVACQSRRTITGPYLEAEAAFLTEIDYATLAKFYGADPQADRKYSPAVCVG
jgi:hypothetical protein